MDFHSIATRVAAEAAKRRSRPSKKVPARVRPSRPAKKPMEHTMLQQPTEYSCRADVSISVEFEGRTSKTALLKKLKDELSASIRAAVSITAKDMNLQPSAVKVQPIKFDCAVLDQGMLEDDEL